MRSASFLNLKMFQVIHNFISQLEPQTRTDKLAVRAVCMSLHPCYMSLDLRTKFASAEGSFKFAGIFASGSIVEKLASWQHSKHIHQYTLIHNVSSQQLFKTRRIIRASTKPGKGKQAEMAVKLSKTQNQELYSMIADNVKYSNV